MCPQVKHEKQTKVSRDQLEKDPSTYDWISEAINGGSFKNVDLHTGTDGWASPRGNLFYFATDEDNPIQPGSLLHKFVHGNDAFRNQRFKIVKGPWIVRAAVGTHAACLLGRALKCEYHPGENLEVDFDIGSSTIANAILRLALGYVTAVTIDMGFVVEAQEEEELPERLIGAVRVAQMKMSLATYVDTGVVAEGGIGGGGVFRGTSSTKVADDCRPCHES